MSSRKDEPVVVKAGKYDSLKEDYTKLQKSYEELLSKYQELERKYRDLAKINTGL